MEYSDNRGNNEKSLRAILSQDFPQVDTWSIVTLARGENAHNTEWWISTSDSAYHRRRALFSPVTLSQGLQKNFRRVPVVEL